jgi:rod shape determining protein RodA
MNLNLLPVTGLTLPFVSYGGSSLMTLFIVIGLVESVVLRHKDLEF